MVIKASSARQVDALLNDLRAPAASTREAAIARLTVVGSAAVLPLAALVQSNERPAARIAALKTIEAIADLRGLRIALQAIDDRDVDVASAAIAAASGFLRGPRGAEVVDRLTDVALDRQRGEALRLAAIHALGELEPSTLAPLVTALETDPLDTVRRALASSDSPADAVDVQAVAEVTRAAAEDLGDDAVALRSAITNARSAVSLASLARILDRIREREQAAPVSQRGDWTAARGATHVALAGRGSRLGLYDLRESFERATTPLPADFLEALSLVGDRECLEPIAAAHAHVGHVGRGSHDAWREQLAEAFRHIAGRERLTRRHAIIKKIEKRWPDAFRQLAGR